MGGGTSRGTWARQGAGHGAGAQSCRTERGLTAACCGPPRRACAVVHCRGQLLGALPLRHDAARHAGGAVGHAAAALHVPKGAFVQGPPPLSALGALEQPGCRGHTGCTAAWRPLWLRCAAAAFLGGRAGLQRARHVPGPGHRAQHAVLRAGRREQRLHLQVPQRCAPIPSPFSDARRERRGGWLTRRLGCPPPWVCRCGAGFGGLYCDASLQSVTLGNSAQSISGILAPGQWSFLEVAIDQRKFNYK